MTSPPVKFPPLPDEERLKIMWAVAVTSALEDQGEAWSIFARLLHHHLTGIYEHARLLQKEND
jgi:hypothetical protein